MRRILSLLAVAGLSGSVLVGLGGVASAQTGGDLEAFCQDRIEAGNTEGKKANLAIMAQMIEEAPDEVVAQMTALRDAYKKKGDKLFDTEQGLGLLAELDGWIYDNCPGSQVPTTARDYEFDGVPESLPAGFATFKLTNDAPEEDHEMIVVKLTDAAAGQDVADLLSLPEKKQRKYFDFSSVGFMYAPPGQTFYAPIDLEPGEYAYACFLPVGGKKNGEPHFMEGMYGTFTVE